MPRRRGGAAIPSAVLGLAVAAVIGCGGPPPPSGTTTTEPRTPAATPALPPSVTPGPAEPPVATMGVEGGDPVVGQLGTYAWAGGGSSSPWLPGSPIAVGSKETLTVLVRPSVVISDWTAHIAPAAGDGSRAVVIASGVGQPVMEAPQGGSWTIAVTVRFGALGSATYAWRLEVS
jgi:hypothetical protein